MLRICLASGAEAAALSKSQLQDIAAEGRGTVVRDLKQHLHRLTGVPRFRQRLVHDGRSLRDELVVGVPLCLQLVMLNFREASEQDLVEFYRAVKGDSSEKVETFLTEPLDPNLQLPLNQLVSPLHVAARYGGLRSARLLLEAGAEKERLTGQNLKAMHVATGRGDLEFVRLLVEDAADISQAHRTLPRDYLHFACFQGHLEVARFLFQTLEDTRLLSGMLVSFFWVSGWAPVIICTIKP